MIVPIIRMMMVISIKIPAMIRHVFSTAMIKVSLTSRKGHKNKNTVNYSTFKDILPGRFLHYIASLNDMHSLIVFQDAKLGIIP